jgi:hypothetical protein
VPFSGGDQRTLLGIDFAALQAETRGRCSAGDCPNRPFAMATGPTRASMPAAFGPRQKLKACVRPGVTFGTGCFSDRGLSNMLVIAEIVRRLDVVAVQEVRRRAQAFLAMMTVLGADWASWPPTSPTGELATNLTRST